MERSATVYTVTTLTSAIKMRVESDPNLMDCLVRGEISNFKHHTSGHMYFTLKDDRSRIRAVMFSSRNKGLAFIPEDGMRVVCHGSIGVFERDGQYQMYVDEMQPDGIGALFVAFAQLKEKLQAQGLFDEARKRPLPRYPRRIGVVTSATGAVIQDIRTTLSRRYPLAKVVFAPASVQGPGAALTIVRAIERLVALQDDERIDVLIVGRGGGSLEELWPFNEEVVARAISECPIPVISAVGHETDYTICDFVADVRAATPTAAAELVAPNMEDLRLQLLDWGNRSRTALLRNVKQAEERFQRVLLAPSIKRPLHRVDVMRQQVDYIEGQLRRFVAQPIHVARKRVVQVTDRLHRMNPSNRIARVRSRLDQAQSSAYALIKEVLLKKSGALDKTIASLEAMNPLTVLRRGYSVAYNESRHAKGNLDAVVTSVNQVQPGDLLRLMLSDGEVKARITGGEGNGERTEQYRLDI